MSEPDRLKCTFLNIVGVKDTALINSGLVATFGLLIISMDMYLSKVKLIRKKDGSFYVAPPSEKYKDPQTGKDVYSNFFWFGEKTSEFFQKEAVKALNTYCLAKGIANPMISQHEPQRELSGYNAGDYKAAPETQTTFKTAGSISDPTFSY